MNFRKIKFKLIKIFFLLILTSSFSQQEKVNFKLDNKNGFKDFKFGESAILHQSYLSKLKDKNQEFLLTHWGDRDYKVYDLNNRNVTELFGFYWTDFRLLFLKDQLISIEVRWNYSKYFFNDVIDELVQKLEIIFGEAELTKGYVIDEYIWRGQKVEMKLTGKPNPRFFEIYGKNDHPESFTLTITAKGLESKILYDFESEF